MELGNQVRANLWPITGNFADILEHRFSKEKENELTFDLLFRIYSAIYLGLSINALSENLTSFANGYRFWNDELLTEKGELVTENSSDTDILNALVKLLKDNKSKVDILVLKYIERIEGKEKIIVREFIDEVRRMEEKNKPSLKIIQEIIEAMQLAPTPINGKYYPSSGDYKQFVFWIVKNKYDEYLTPDNFFTYIHCTVKKETISRYYSEARDEDNK